MQGDYDNASDSIKDSGNGSIRPKDSIVGNKVTIGRAGGADVLDLNSCAVYGAKGQSGDTVGNNEVWINSGKMGSVNGGIISADLGTVTNNKVYVSGGTIASVRGGFGLGYVAITGNEVYVTNSSIISEYGGVYGAYGDSYSAITDNVVHISDSTVAGEVMGGHTNYSGAVTGNKVYISGNTVIEKNVYGGDCRGKIEKNEVHISGGTIEKNIYGGYAHGNAATGNSVTISGRPTFAADSVIYGGYSASGGEVSGNILNIKSTGITVSNIKNFDVYNFYLPDTVQADDVLLTVTGGSSNEQTDLKGSSVNVGITGSAPALKSGDNVTLLHNANGILADETTVYGKMTQGVSLEYDFTTVLQNGDSLVTTIIKSGISDDTKSLVETQAAAAGFINSGADMLVSSGITSMSKVTSAEDNAIFGAMSGGSMRYDTGSHADVKGYNFALGMGKAVANNAGRLTFGPFVEYGYGDYTSYLDNGVRGDGKTKYYGVGVLARQDDKSGVYYEGSLRYGRMDADYASNDLGTAGVHSSYDSSSAYYGAHLGIGKVTGLNDTTKADVYAKLLYTHQNGDSVTLQGEGNGEVYDFDAVDSTRARVGARVSKAYSERGTGYVGLAYEYEFDGEARATVKGFSTPAPSIKGSSGLVELGYILQPQGVNDPTINIGLQGWGGKKQGFTGNVDFVWTF